MGKGFFLSLQLVYQYVIILSTNIHGGGHMENYTITQLAEMFKTTRNTVYKKLDDPTLQEYIYTNEKGHRTLSIEGLNTFTMLMSNRKAMPTKQEINEHGKTPTYHDEYIQSLHDQITLIKQENARLLDEKAEITRKYDSLFDVYMMLTKPQPKLEEPKKWFWQK
jgi:hypothetical protein